MQCDRCGERFIEIDRYGERLTGCIECNRWSSNKSAFVVELSVEDFEALKNLEVNGQEARGEYHCKKKPRPTGGKLGASRSRMGGPVMGGKTHHSVSA
jgi:hypothetical protein